MSLIEKITAELDEEVAGIDKFRAIVAVDLKIMQDAVDGVYEPTEYWRETVEAALNRVIAFYKRRVGGNKIGFPDSFWTDESTKEVATLISLTWKWLMGDDLIRFSEAAAILRGIDPEQYSRNENSGDRIYMHNLTRTHLKVYWDVTDKYPRRVSRKEVNDYIEQQNIKKRPD